MEYSPAASITTRSPACIVPESVGIVQHGGIEARAHDGRVRRTLTATLSPLILHQGGDLTLGDARLHRMHGGEVRGNRGVGGVTDALDFSRILSRFGARPASAGHPGKTRRRETHWRASANPEARLNSKSRHRRQRRCKWWLSSAGSSRTSSERRLSRTSTWSNPVILPASGLSAPSFGPVHFSCDGLWLGRNRISV